MHFSNVLLSQVEQTDVQAKSIKSLELIFSEVVLLEKLEQDEIFNHLPYFLRDINVHLDLKFELTVSCVNIIVCYSAQMYFTEVSSHFSF